MFWVSEYSKPSSQLRSARRIKRWFSVDIDRVGYTWTKLSLRDNQLRFRDQQSSRVRKWWINWGPALKLTSGEPGDRTPRLRPRSRGRGIKATKPGWKPSRIGGRRRADTQAGPKFGKRPNFLPPVTDFDRCLRPKLEPSALKLKPPPSKFEGAEIRNVYVSSFCERIEG